MPDEIHARPLGVAITALIAATLCGCTAAAPSPAPVDVALPGSPTLRSLIEAEPEHPVFDVVQETTDFDGDHAEVVSYESGGLQVQAVIRRPPSGAANSPAIVFVHGDVDPEDYSGLTAYDGLADEFVSRGYVVVMPDLRNHADSDDDPSWATDVDVGSTLDVINAVQATAADGMVDPDRIALMGHSHGGGVALNVAVTAPDAAAAIVAAAPVSPTPWENIERHGAGSPYFDAIVAAHGTPEESPAFWRDVSASTFVDRASAPLLIVHGQADDIIPLAWSEGLEAAWTAAGKDARFVPLTDADHMFEPSPELMIDAVAAFLAESMP